MGTETILRIRYEYSNRQHWVKLNNPLMGTETPPLPRQRSDNAL